MKLIIQKYVCIFLATVLLSALNISTGYAHDMWINMQNYTLEKSKPGVLTLGYGHIFAIPGKELLPRDQVEKAFFLDPDGKEIPAVAGTDNSFQSKTVLKKPGSYVAVVQKQGGFSSKTTDGYKRGKNKKDLKDVIECSYSEKYAKALFTAGTPGGKSFSQVLGHPIEIVPLKDPSTLKKGDELPVKVLIHGKPARTTVFGTYAGFSNEKNTFAYTTSTDKDGIAKIRFVSNGIWLLIAKQEAAYPDATVCDKQSYAASLTFEVK
jgi:uncharacterized GH25 family protein